MQTPKSLPWEAETVNTGQRGDDGKFVHVVTGVVQTAAGRIVCVCGDSLTKREDAAYIAHACNAYPELLAALQAAERVIRALRYGSAPASDETGDWPIFAIIADAIRAAEEREE